MTWLPFGTPATDEPRLFCFPNAGAGAAAFAQWRTMAEPGVEVCPIQSPGRAERFREPAHRTVDALLDDLLGAIGTEFAGPYALYGHSLGALVVFELARRLQARGGDQPVHVFVSGRAAPQLPDTRLQLHELPTPALIPELRKLGGTPESVLRETELLEMFLPTLRADFAVNEDYTYADTQPLAVPLTVFGGSTDPRADADELHAWSALTSAAFELRVFEGGHFLIDPYARELLAAMTAPLRSHQPNSLRSASR
jgi:medium-chain acyl-[acyl-carrier-protein] hydrolase